MGKRAFVFAAFGLAVMLLGAVPASAAPSLEVKASGGLDGKAKEGSGFPVQIEIHNSGDPFSGDLILDFHPGYRSGTAEAIPVEVGSGETAVIRTDVEEADSYSYQENGFRFFEGGWEKGREIKYKGDRYPKLSFYFEDAQFLVALSDSGDRLAALKDAGAGPSSEKVFIQPMKDEGFLAPDEKSGWGSADVIFVDETVMPGLTAAEQEAIGGWVKDGGTLVLGGSDDPETEAGIFADRLPLKITGRTEIDGAGLSALVPGAEFPETVPGFAAEAGPGATSLARADGKLIAAWLPYGSGKIVQTAFSLGDKPLSEAPGYPLLMTRLLTGAPSAQAGGNWMYANPQDGFVDLGKSATERFATFDIPFPAILAVVILYIVVIGPILYVLLKRKDKREHAWWIIPAVSAALSAGLFAYGAKDRLLSPQLRQAAVLIDDGSGSPSGKFIGSVLTNRAGDVEFRAPSGLTLTATGSSNPFTGSASDSLRHAVAEKGAEGTRLVLRNLPFWSVGTVYGDVSLREGGSIETDLKSEEGVLSGTVENGLDVRLKDVSIWSGLEFIPVGDLEAGERKEVHAVLKGGQLLPAVSGGYGQAGGLAGSANGYGSSKDPRAAEMAEAASLLLDGNSPAVIGRTDSSLIPLKMSGNPVQSSVTVIVRPFEPDVRLTGQFTVPAELLATLLQPEEDPDLYYEKSPDGEMYMEPGNYVYEARVPEAFNAAAESWKSLSVGGGRGLDDISLLNVRTGEYETLDAGQQIDPPEDYVSEDGEIRMKFRKLPGGDMAELPEIGLEGVAAP
ncbi:hypothetical protein [Bhargavaea ullalensis]|uniref:Uncharacterized protein n=2 Tax=Bhargavaea ullalensis TaxID=1265685 RepID=A0ABV2GC07_9BACL